MSPPALTVLEAAQQAPHLLPALACRCGRGLRPQDMHRPPQMRPTRAGNGVRIEPIICAMCAERIGAGR